jgi:hypothetical protein
MTSSAIHICMEVCGEGHISSSQYLYLSEIIDHHALNYRGLLCVSHFRTDCYLHECIGGQFAVSLLKTLRPVERDSLPIFPGQDRRVLKRPVDPNRGNTDYRANEQRVVPQSAVWLGGSHEPTDY